MRNGFLSIALAGFSLATTASAQPARPSSSTSRQPRTASTPDVTGWNKIQWGMTVAQAKRLLGTTATDPEEKPTPGERYPVRLVMNNIDIGGLPCSATIATDRDADSIASVVIEPPERFQKLAQLRATVFDKLKELLIQKCGKPKSDDRPQEAGDINSRVLWVFPSTTIELYRSEGRFDLGYVLLTYHAVDKKAVNAL